MPPVATVTPNGPEIRRLRSLRGWEARDVAARIPGRHPKSIGKLERGGTASLVLISQVARVLGVEPAQIILDDSDDEPEPGKHLKKAA